MQNNNYILFHKEQLLNVFDLSVFPTIIRFIRNQTISIEAKTGKLPVIMLLVSGFGRCLFVHQVLEKEFRTKKGKSKSAQPLMDIITDQGDKPWSAISRGAVEHALKPRVGTRIAQRSIGFQQKIPAPVKEGGVYDEVFSDYRLPDGMSWVVKKVSPSALYAGFWLFLLVLVLTRNCSNRERKSAVAAKLSPRLGYTPTSTGRTLVKGPQSISPSFMHSTAKVPHHATAMEQASKKEEL